MPLSVRFREHKKYVKDGKTYILKLVEHVWYEQHKVVWYEADFAGLETNTENKGVVEASCVAANYG